MAERNYSKREQDHFQSEWGKRMDKQDNTLERIEGQTTKTNGRVTQLENKTEDYSKTKEQLEVVSTWRTEFMAEIRGMRRIMVVVVIVLPSLISGIFVLYINHLRDTIINDAAIESSKQVLSSLKETYTLQFKQTE